MSITVEKAQEILKKYNSEDFHIQHGDTVSGVLGWFAQQHDPSNEEYWRIVGTLHDVDYEKYPDEHCVKGIELLRSEGVGDDIIKSAMSHGWGMTGSPYEPELYMEKMLYAIDELTGFIWAVSIVRPSKSVQDLELKSVKKKFKDKKFAAGADRDVMIRGAEMLGIELDDLITQTILAMRSIEA